MAQQPDGLNRQMKDISLTTGGMKEEIDLVTGMHGIADVGVEGVEDR